jgi:hypothetical protein
MSISYDEVHPEKEEQVKQRVDNGERDERHGVPTWRDVSRTDSDDGVPGAHHAEHHHRQENVFILERKSRRARVSVSGADTDENARHLPRSSSTRSSVDTEQRPI